MEFYKSVEGTMSELLCHMIKRTDYLNIVDLLAIVQEYSEWIKCIRNKGLVPQNILFINTSTFGKIFNKSNPFIYLYV